MEIPDYPLRFDPVYKSALWGGDRIPKVFGRKLPPGVYAESWEVSCLKEGPSRVANGPFAGRLLPDLLARFPREVLGRSIPGPRLPLLFKLIDARKALSVQVHPNARNAQSLEGDPKTEAWYFLNEESAETWCGLKAGTTRRQFEAAVAEGRVEALLRRVSVRKGDALFVPGGRVHAIGAGALLYEVQRNSDTTYRIFDWNRTDENGRPRELHLEKGLQAVEWGDHDDPRVVPEPLESVPGVERLRLTSCDFFTLEKIVLGGGVLESPLNGDRFQVLFVAGGNPVLRWKGGEKEIAAGTSLLLPAAMGDYELGGNAEVLRTTPKAPR